MNLKLSLLASFTLIDLTFYWPDLFNPPNIELINDRRILNTSAHQNPSTVNPGTNQSTNNIRMVFITKRNNPNVTMVIGIVNITNTGFTRRLRMANTPATTMAIKNPSTWAPGKTVAQITTAIADNTSLIIKLFIERIYVLSKI